MKSHLRSLISRLSHWLLGRHPYNTIFSYNWVNVRRMIRTFRVLRDIFQGRVADLGSGASPYYDLIAPTASSYIAIDYPNALPQKDMRPIQRVAGVIEAIPLSAESIDVAFCSQVLSQVARPADALQEIKRILRPGGYAVISVPHVSALHSEPHDLYRFTPDGLSWLVRLAGLKTRSIHIQGQLFSSFALCLAMSLVLSPVVSGHPMKLLPVRQLLFAPLIAFVNGLAYLSDVILPFNRTPTNFVLVARKA